MRLRSPTGYRRFNRLRRHWREPGQHRRLRWRRRHAPSRTTSRFQGHYRRTRHRRHHRSGEYHAERYCLGHDRWLTARRRRNQQHGADLQYRQQPQQYAVRSCGGRSHRHRFGARVIVAARADSDDYGRGSHRLPTRCDPRNWGWRCPRRRYREQLHDRGYRRRCPIRF